mmetsp:Transcript_29141/g.58196  ORF Transcript_29141/g.58196 Transcript_29141/m.58196 type:complete len:256 (-) Transcript_29141:1025-1792(-)
MTFLFLFFLRNVYSSRNLLSLGHSTYPCSRPAAVASDVSFSTSTYTADFWMERRARSSTFLVWVAEKSIVCLFLGRSLMMDLRSSSKPISRILSASSMTNTCRLSYLNPLVFCMWSKSLPGVATRTQTPRPSLSASVFLFAPPMTSPCVCGCPPAPHRSLSTPYICRLSSRVGDITMAPVPLREDHFTRQRSSRVGTRKARVLPLPVFAAPTRSEPERRGGIDFCWICVMVVKFRVFRARAVWAVKGRDEKEVVP